MFQHNPDSGYLDILGPMFSEVVCYIKDTQTIHALR